MQGDGPGPSFPSQAPAVDIMNQIVVIAELLGWVTGEGDWVTSVEKISALPKWLQLESAELKQGRAGLAAPAPGHHEVNASVHCDRIAYNADL